MIEGVYHYSSRVNHIEEWLQVFRFSQMLSINFAP